MARTGTTDLNQSLLQNRGYLPQGTERLQGSKLQYLLAAVLVLLLSAGAARLLLPGKQKPENLQVVAAGQDIPAGCKISFNSLHYLTIPNRYACKGMFFSYEQLAGKTAGTYLKKGNPILKSDLLTGSLAESLPPGKRAITLRLDAESQVDNALHPGDRVDVIATSSTDSGGGKSRKFTKTICQNLTVLLSTPREQIYSANSRNSDSNRVTVSASAADCEKLSQAADTAKIRLVLRNPAAPAEEYLPGAESDDLLPAFALKKIAEELAAKQAQAPVLPMILPPPPPAFPPAALSLPAPGAEASVQEPARPPLQWIVEMFSGAKKESYVLPLK